LSPNAIISFYIDSLLYKIQGVYFVHKPDSSYISNFLHGDYCTIVIEIPLNEFGENKIEISQIHHLTESFEDVVRGNDYSCMIDVNCSEGNDWCDQKRSVAIFYFTEKDGRYQCTGALVNNYRNNFTQYFLTARHCTNEIIDWSTTEFCFNYQKSFCNSEDGIKDSTYKIQGSQLVGYCDISWSDNALLLIIESIPIQANVYYAGVDITNRSMGDKVTCIHHSKGRPKKIVYGKLQNFAGPKWEMYWNNGIVTYGGSGSPVFLNSNKRVIATVASVIPNLDCSNNLKQNWVGKVKACMSYSGNMQDALFGNSGLESYAGIDPIIACQSTLNLQGNFYSTHEYDATLDGLTIQASNTINVSNANFYSESNYTLTAGDKIVFLPGTTIKSGSNVVATIVPCSDNLVFCGVHSSNYKNTEIYSQTNDKNKNSAYFKNSSIEDKHNRYLIDIYPNPNSGNFQLETNFPLSEIGNFKIMNLLGITVYETQHLVSNTIQINSSPAGQYFVVMILKDGNVVTRKVVVQ
jgi:hypothetical protein